jgi:nitrogen-specific signal transduction histidine kinase
MGLWITYQIVHQLKGEIDATSADSLTRFTVLLPLPESDDSDAPDDCHDA